MKTSIIAALAAGFVAVCATTAQAQVSLEDLDAAMGAGNDRMEAFRERLNDPDPDRALAAMALLISQGDADQRRMALRHGLYSTESAIRATVLRAILDSSPALTMQFIPVGEVDGNWTNVLNNYAKGTVLSDGSAQVAAKILEYDSENDCWMWKYYNRDTCFARMRGEEVLIQFNGNWSSFFLNGEGVLVGQMNVVSNTANVGIDLSE